MYGRSTLVTKTSNTHGYNKIMDYHPEEKTGRKLSTKLINQLQKKTNIQRIRITEKERKEKLIQEINK